MRFAAAPGIGPTAIVLEPGNGGPTPKSWRQRRTASGSNSSAGPARVPLSGAFGGEIRIGYRIRHGKIRAVRGGTVGGVVLGPPGTASMLTSITVLGSTARLIDNFSGPTVLVKPLTVAGA